jgi:hypothetical protein
MCICVYVCMCVCVYVCMHVCFYVCECMYACMYDCVCVCVCVRVCMRACLHTSKRLDCCSHSTTSSYAVLFNPRLAWRRRAAWSPSTLYNCSLNPCSITSMNPTGCQHNCPCTFYIQWYTLFFSCLNNTFTHQLFCVHFSLPPFTPLHPIDWTNNHTWLNTTFCLCKAWLSWAQVDNAKRHMRSADRLCVAIFNHVGVVKNCPTADVQDEPACIRARILEVNTH